MSGSGQPLSGFILFLEVRLNSMGDFDLGINELQTVAVSQLSCMAYASRSAKGLRPVASKDALQRVPNHNQTTWFPQVPTQTGLAARLGGKGRL
jgi:hypothetical protein